MATTFPPKSVERPGRKFGHDFRPTPETGHNQRLCYTEVMQKRVAVEGLTETLSCLKIYSPATFPHGVSAALPPDLTCICQLEENAHFTIVDKAECPFDRRHFLVPDDRTF